MISNILYEVKSRKNYYRNNLRKVVWALLFAVIIIAMLIAWILYIFFTQPESNYYATMSDGRLFQLMAVPKGTGLLDPENS